MITHPWNLNGGDALNLQQNLASKLIQKDRLADLKYVAGVDVAYDEMSDHLFAAVVVLDADSLNFAETAIAEDQAPFPYIHFYRTNPLTYR
ncbi:endonuclease V [Paenactinomyces guangxiensis]|uniref:endonuclease V n=1 Tax=Paenactinomyces guangxiensis TaxID=1490290 RepID=UPI002867E8AD|nr:endonuclease V [Paenactinomyces guangxiensis]